MWERLAPDLRHAARSLRRRPGYAAAAVATLALVLGANAALFAAVSATLFRPVPLRSGERLVRLLQLPPGVDDPTRAVDLNEASLVEFRGSRTLRALVAFQVRDRALHVGGEPQVARVGEATAGWLALALEPPALGRTYTAAEDRAGERVAVLGWELWRRVFAGSPAAVGARVLIDGEPFTVVGVMPPGFPPHFVDAELWVPLAVGRGLADGGAGRANLRTLGLLAPGADAAAASAEIAARMRRVVARLPALADERATVVGLRPWLYGPYRAPFTVLGGAMLLLLLLACANLAGLALAQVRARAAEMRLRQTLGGSRASLARLVLVETSLLAAGGAALGLGLAAVLLPLLLRLDPGAARALGPVGLDWRVAAYALASALLVSALAATLPGLLASTEGAGHDAQGSGRSHGSRRADGWRGALVVAQTAVCLALLVGCGLLLRALQRSTAIEPGFAARGVVAAQVRLSAQRHATPEERIRIVEAVLARARALPGVVEAATGLGDFTPDNAWVTTVAVEGAAAEPGRPLNVQLRRVTPAYFGVLRIPIVAGRTFDARDGLEAPFATVVSRAFAEGPLAGLDPIGRRVVRGDRTWTIVGVVEDVRDVNLVKPPEPTLYLPWHQSNTATSPVALLVRTHGDPGALGPALARAVREVDPLLPFYGVKPLEGYLAASIAPQRFRLALLGWLAGVGLLIAAIGVAGLTAQTVGERMGELGVRLALGGNHVQLWVSAVARQLRRVALGGALGAGLALAGGRLAAALLPELAGFDLAAIALAALVLGGAAAVAAAVPAGRVLRLDPMRVLRP